MTNRPSGTAADFVSALELQRAGRPAEAELLYRAVIAAGGESSVDARVNLGALLDESGRGLEALDLYREALSLRPQAPACLNNIGSTLFRLGRFAEAATYFEKALALCPDSPEIAVALGASLQREGELPAAIDCFRRGLKRHPQDAELHWNLALALLQNGDFPEGWAEYQWRWRRDGFTSPRRDFAVPTWDGSPLSGRTVLVHGEQGFGDTIQFARYLPMVAARGGRVIAECQSEALVPLLAGIPGVAEVRVMGEPLPHFDLEVPLLSLPFLFGTTLHSVPAEVPYLAPPPERLPSWSQKLSGDAGFKVGLVWAGKPVPDPFRSSSLEAFAPFLEIPGVSCYSLQLGEGGARPAEAPGLVDLTAGIVDFGDTAALVSRLDLVISVDTSVAHLAGALGRPVWLLLPKGGDYRWLNGRDDSPWYPTMRIFRQKRQGEWGEVIGRVAAQLSDAALAFLERRLAARPLDGSGHYLLGLNLAARGRLFEAGVRLSKAVHLLPGRWEPQYALAQTQQQMGMWQGARENLEEALALSPGTAVLHEALGIASQVEGDLPGAMARYREALQVDPTLSKARFNLAIALKECGRFAEALEEFRETVERHPGHADAHWNLSVMSLLTGDYGAGWREFGWRFKKSSQAPAARWAGHPAWDGSPLAGRTILLWGEQGAGDTLQFVRYASLVRELGGRVLVEVQSAGLKGLVASAPGVELVLAAGETPPPFDLQASLMDLPALFGTTLDTIPRVVPYLRPDPARLAACRELIPEDERLKVGLAWRGNPGHANDLNRSAPLSRLAAITGTPGVTFYSLQLGEGVQEELKAAPEVIDLSPHIADYCDTAALVAKLDLIVSVDTSVAHLSGALGRPTFLLVPYLPDWRWLVDREDSPWYPSLRLFRQAAPGDWEGVAARVSRALALLAGPRHEAPAGGSDPVPKGLPRAELFNNEACAFAARGEHAAALDRYREAIALCPEFLAPHYNMGNSLYALGRFVDAVESFRRALAIDPSLPQGWHNLGLAHQSAGRLDDALHALERAIAVVPGYLEARHNLGELRHRRGELSEAEAVFRAVVADEPGYLPSLNALGIALQGQGRLEEAADCYRRAVGLNPEYLHALNNLGTVSRAMGDLESAAGCYRRVLALDPAYADARWNLALVQLQLGEYREGWQGYEWRFEKVDPIPRLITGRPEWDGAPLAGRRILLYAEQGFGDTFQFVRYAPELARRGATVFLQCQTPPIAQALATLPGVARVLVRGEPLPDHDCHAALMSLPHLTGTTLETIPLPIPYLAADPERVALWRPRLAGDGLKVGLVWAGSRSYQEDLKRSLTLALFAPLAGVPGVRFFSLQVGSGAEEAALPPPGLSLTDLGGGIADFADTAAILSQLDLLITADTAPAHLAGALGLPFWVLLPAACDWRWLCDRADSPWYPTARLFRQRRRGEWPEVLARVAAELDLVAIARRKREAS